ncbi:hypothetical protein BT96DRAFT_917901 [Gymnopus androsaceus JB14]|uniref:Mid2 domain-containing protein n=1 Tax=Gymnopus androsaceus JB14 TaxID=1447944 RepID=A0A6A4HX28_9AGAR|nr:hypothetical protein BT96DRAFT_917901 [Gymnopus androsaceus JB14]
MGARLLLTLLFLTAFFTHNLAVELVSSSGELVLTETLTIVTTLTTFTSNTTPTHSVTSFPSGTETSTNSTVTVFSTSLATAVTTIFIQSQFSFLLPEFTTLDFNASAPTSSAPSQTLTSPSQATTTAALPSDLPSEILPGQNQLSSSTDPTGYTLISLLYSLQLGWQFVVGNSVATDQIFAWMPVILQTALSLNSNQVLTWGLQVHIPTDYTGAADAALLETMYLVYIPSNTISNLQDQIRDNQSAFYTSVTVPIAQQLVSLVNSGEDIVVSSSPISSSLPITSTASPSQKHSEPVKAIIGGVIGGVAALCVLVFSSWLVHRHWRGRKQLQDQRMPKVYDMKMAHESSDLENNIMEIMQLSHPHGLDVGTITPYDLKPNRPSSTILEMIDSTQQQRNALSSSHETVLTARQIHIAQETQVARDNLRMLEQTRNESESEDRIVLIQQRMAEMMSRILQMEAERSSDWARGLTDEPPPSYSSENGRVY